MRLTEDLGYFKRLFEACLVIWIDAAALISGVDLFNTYLLTYLLTFSLTDQILTYLLALIIMYSRAVLYNGPPCKYLNK